MSLLTGWENFYVILGSAAAGLMGLTFVVIALLADSGRSSMAGLRAFVTPTVFHFGIVLGLSAFLSMPRLAVPHLEVGLGIVGILGLVHVSLVTVSLRRVASSYVPVREDWIWHVLLPAMAYAALTIMGILISSRPAQVLYAVGGTTTGLLFIGIHNAWDVAVSISLRKQPDQS
jgi:hypothetical protein